MVWKSIYDIPESLKNGTYNIIGGWWEYDEQWYATLVGYAQSIDRWVRQDGSRVTPTHYIESPRPPKGFI